MSTARQQAVVLAELLRHERDALAEFLSALADFDRRRAWVDLGHDSLFAFLVRRSATRRTWSLSSRPSRLRRARS
jgi:hypothetical protein